MCEMASVENSQTEVSHHAAAIDRWENEGGASNLSSSMTNTKLSKEHQRPLADNQEEAEGKCPCLQGARSDIAEIPLAVPTEEHP